MHVLEMLIYSKMFNGLDTLDVHIIGVMHYLGGKDYCPEKETAELFKLSQITSGWQHTQYEINLLLIKISRHTLKPKEQNSKL